MLLCIGLCLFNCLYQTVIGITIKEDAGVLEQIMMKEQIHEDGSVSQMDLHTFEIMMPNSDIANYAAQDILTRGSLTEYLIVNFIKSRFCLGHKVIVEVTTDDTKSFKNIITSTEDRPEVSWTKLPWVILYSKKSYLSVTIVTLLLVKKHWENNNNNAMELNEDTMHDNNHDTCPCIKYKKQVRTQVKTTKIRL